MKYNQVSPLIWTPALRDLRREHPDAFELYLYLVTCRHRNSEGLFWLPVKYMAIDLGMDPDDVTAALAALERANYANYDHDAEVVLDRRALDYYQPKGPSQTKGAINRLEEVPKTALKSELIKVAFTAGAKSFADELIGALKLNPLDTHPTGSREGVDTDSTPREELELEHREGVESESRQRARVKSERAS